MQHETKHAGGAPELRLVDRSELCPLCGAQECPPQCPSQEWPPPLDARLILTRCLIGLVCFFALAAMVVPVYGLKLGLALTAFACALLYATLRLSEVPEGQGRVDSKGQRHEEVRAHFASEPHLIFMPSVDGSMAHQVCSDRCEAKLRATPDFSCFFDGCQCECCACGRCSDPAQCGSTGKGYVWHQ